MSPTADAGVASGGETLQVKDCALVTIATGEGAQNLREFRAHLENVHSGSLYYHFWSPLLRTYDDREYREYNNDFARWARYGLLDRRLAERLAIVDPAEFEDLEELRNELLEILDARIHETDHVPWAKREEEFHFIRAQLVVFDTDHRATTPGALSRIVPGLPLSSIFYHFVDARSRSPDGIDDFSRWLRHRDGNHEALRRELASLDLYFTTLSALRDELAELFRRELEGR